MQQPRAEAGLGLQGVPESMAEIEQFAVARLAFVAGDDLGLHDAALDHGASQGLGRKGADRLALGLEPDEKFGIAE